MEKITTIRDIFKELPTINQLTGSIFRVRLTLESDELKATFNASSELSLCKDLGEFIALDILNLNDNFLNNEDVAKIYDDILTADLVFRGNGLITADLEIKRQLFTLYVKVFDLFKTEQGE